MKKKFLMGSIIISILCNIGAIFFICIAINGLAVGTKLTLWEMVLNVGPLSVPLLILSYFEYRVLKNLRNESLTIKDEIVLLIAGVLKFGVMKPITILNLVTAYIVMKERWVSEKASKNI